MPSKSDVPNIVLVFVLPEFRLENSTPMEDESYPEIVAIFLTPLISSHPCKTISLCNHAFSLMITFFNYYIVILASFY